MWMAQTPVLLPLAPSSQVSVSDMWTSSSKCTVLWQLESQRSGPREQDNVPHGISNGHSNDDAILASPSAAAGTRPRGQTADAGADGAHEQLHGSNEQVSMSHGDKAGPRRQLLPLGGIGNGSQHMGWLST